MSISSNIKKLRSCVKNILLKEWDPIGVADVDEAQDEYDSYVPSFVDMLMHGATENEILDHLTWIEVARIGLESDFFHRKNIARKLLLLRNE